jgi:hypothetical protein
VNLAELLEAAQDLPALLARMPEEDLRKLDQAARARTGNRRFVPNPGAQTVALKSSAEIMMFGGSAGSGKTSVSVGLAEDHLHTIIFRREASQTDGLEKFSKELFQGQTKYNGTDLEHTWPDGRTLKFAGMQNAADWMKHAGRERDAILFDEAGEFLEEQVASLMAWNRGPKGQRCRMVFPTNPPRSSDGAWVRKWFAPWIDPGFPEPAESGEIRWAFMVANREGGIDPHWCDGPGETFIGGKHYTARSLTFVRASLKDNPFRDTPEYRASLESLPEPLRSQVLYGDFGAGTEDVEWQAIPSAWVHAAQARWTEQPPIGVPMCAVGVDVALGGKDKAAISRRYDGWFAPMVTMDGQKIKSGKQLAGEVVTLRSGGARIIVDVGGGWGADCYAQLARNQLPVDGYMGVRSSAARTRDKQFGYFNIRSQAIWQFREALDPYQEGGSHIKLPPSARLVADLTAPRYDTKSGVMRIESKEDVCKRLKRSTDEGDAVVMAWHVGAKIASHYEEWKSNSARPKVITTESLSGRIAGQSLSARIRS